MIPINRKFFEVVFKNFEIGFSRSLGTYRLSGFNYAFGKPSEKDIFERAVSQGKVFVARVENASGSSYIYHENEEALEEEYFAKMKS